MYRVGDPHHENADPDPSYHFHADPDPTFKFDASPKILLLIKVMGICDRWYTDPPRLHFEPRRLHCEPLMVLKFSLKGTQDLRFFLASILKFVLFLY